MVDINNKRLSGRLTSAQIETEINKSMNEMLKYQYGIDTYNINRKKVSADLVNSMLDALGNNPTSFFARQFAGDLFGKRGDSLDLFDPNYWNR